MESTADVSLSRIGRSSDGNSRRTTDWREMANIALRDAMINERSKKWNKVVSDYSRMLQLLNDVIPSDDSDRLSSMTLLLYECHYHLGVALQQVNQQKNSIKEFTRAIKALFISRNGCMVTRCRVASCLMTPIYARRAFAHAHTGDLKNASLDAEKAVVLDSTNPDVYCVRALVLNTTNKTTQAAEDVRKALRLNQNHVCALILQGQFKNQRKQIGSIECSATQGQSLPEEHAKAVKLNPDSFHYLTVNSFHDEKILAFYDKFLYSLNVPHTISSVTLESEDRSSLGIDRVKDGRMLSRSISLPAFSGSNCSSNNNMRMPTCVYSRMSSVADCVSMATGGRSSSIRGQLKTGRLSTGKDRSRPLTVRSDIQMKRKPHYSDQLTSRSTLDRRKSYGQAVTNGNAKATKLSAFIPVERLGPIAERKTPFQSRSFDESYNSEPQLQMGLTQTVEDLQIFQEVNLYDAPRPYYRPWVGDRLPVDEIKRKQTIFPPFKV